MCIVCSIHYVDYRGRITSRLHSEYVCRVTPSADTTTCTFLSISFSLDIHSMHTQPRLPRPISKIIHWKDKQQQHGDYLVITFQREHIRCFCFSWLMIEITSFLVLRNGCKCQSFKSGMRGSSYWQSVGKCSLVSGNMHSLLSFFFYSCLE